MTSSAKKLVNPVATAPGTDLIVIATFGSRLERSGSFFYQTLQNFTRVPFAMFRPSLATLVSGAINLGHSGLLARATAE